MKEGEDKKKMEKCNDCSMQTFDDDLFSIVRSGVKFSSSSDIKQNSE